MSDTTGKRRTAAGTNVLSSMPTYKVMAILDELESLEFDGYITFHHLSEAFLVVRLIEVAMEARKRGMRPYVHTNGNVLRNSEELCRKTARVFEYVVVGLYDYKREEEKTAEKQFWRQRLDGTQVMFSLVENVYRRTYSPETQEMRVIERRTFPTAACAHPQKYLLIHYNGDVCCCCEDMYGDLLRANIFDRRIRDIWYSKQHTQIVRDLRAGARTRYDLCSKCTMGPSVYTQDPMDDTRHLDR
jgi:radical SAM protein with 4Fe4S-binding SPASM domain